MEEKSRQIIGVIFITCCVFSLLVGASLLQPFDGSESLLQPPATSGGEDNQTSNVTGIGEGTSTESGESDGGSNEQEPQTEDNERALHTGEIEYDIEFSRPLIPGQSATVTVQRNEAPIEGILVRVNGEAIDRTDQFGRITITVPFDTSLNVSVQPPASRLNQQRTAGTAPRSLSKSRFYNLQSDTKAQAGTATRQSSASRIRENVTLPTNLTVRPLGEPRSGLGTVFVVQIAGTVVENATIRRNGTVVGRTDARGRIDMDIPWAAATNITATRGVATGTYQADLGGLQLSISTAGQLPMAAGQPVTVAVTKGGRPISNASVTIGEQPPQGTGDSGSLQAQLPQSNAVTITTSKAGLEKSTTLNWLMLPYVSFFVFGSVAIGGLVVVVGARHWLAQITKRGLAATDRISRALLSALVRVTRGSANVVEILRQGITRIISGIRNHDPVARLRGVLSGVLAILLAVPRKLAGVLGRLPPQTEDTSSTEGTEPAAVSSEQDRSPTIREAFARVRAAVPGTTRTLTPTEIGTRAIDQGLPQESVRTIVDGFRDVIYGGRNANTVDEAVARAAADLSEKESTETTEDATDDTAYRGEK